MAVYLPKLSPARGNGLGGFPGTAAVSQPLLTFSRVVITSTGGKIDVPSGAKFMRVTVVGGGGDGGQAAYNNNYFGPGYYYGGGGGGCAATTVVVAQPIEYSVTGYYSQHGAQALFTGVGDFRDGHTVTASFGSRLLIATGGQHGALFRGSAGSLGGTGTGGDYNFTGGAGMSSMGGGGAAGSRGDGAPGDFDGTYGYPWGRITNNDPGGVASGGGGYRQSGNTKPGGNGIGMWTQNGGSGQNAFYGVNPGVNWMWGSTTNNQGGGELGGGGGPYISTGFDWGGVGGNGGIVVEWF